MIDNKRQINVFLIKLSFFLNLIRYNGIRSTQSIEYCQDYGYPCELNCPTFNAMRVFRIEKKPRITELIRQLLPYSLRPDAGRVHIHGFS